MTRLRATLAREPVRAYLYGVAVPVVALLVGVGVLDGDTAALVLGVVTAVLTVPAVESARANVTPTAALEPAGRHAAP